jgi:hypothetical protein
LLWELPLLLLLLLLPGPSMRNAAVPSHLTFGA